MKTLIRNWLLKHFDVVPGADYRAVLRYKRKHDDVLKVIGECSDDTQASILTTTSHLMVTCALESHSKGINMTLQGVTYGGADEGDWQVSIRRLPPTL